ncbi:DoxX family protein, partial [Angustibacter peucedani]
MSVVRRIARPMLAAMFVEGGLDQLRHPAAKAKAAAPVVEKLAPVLGLPDDPELLVRANGAAMVGAGALLATGRLPRLSAAVLAASLVPTTVAGHRFWQADDPAQRTQQKLHFFKNVSMLGGLLIAAVDTAGKPGLPWRARRAAKDTARTARLARREARHAAHAARR